MSNKAAIKAQSQKAASKTKITTPLIRIVKCSVGIDVSKDTLNACFGLINAQQKVTLVSNKVFKNSASGHQALLNWSKRLYDSSLKAQNKQQVQQKGEVALCFLMEATGVYYEGIAYFLYKQVQKVSVLVPNKVKNYGKSLDNKSKTDKADAQTIAQMILERHLDTWHPPSQVMRTLKQFTRERQTLKEDKTAALNRLGAIQSQEEPCRASLKRVKEHIAFLDKQIKAVNKDIDQTIADNPELAKKIENVTSIPGVGTIVAATVIAETNGFEHFNNRAQLVSFAGYDVVQNQSGKKEGLTRISKKGNAHIRRILYFAALSSSKYIDKHKQLKDRIVGTTKIPMKGYVAVQRKLLLLIYAIYKSDAPFNPNYDNEIEKATDDDENVQVGHAL